MELQTLIARIAADCAGPWARIGREQLRIIDTLLADPPSIRGRFLDYSRARG